MTFQESITSVIKEFGKDILDNPSVVNILSDYNGYEESRAFRIILRIIISEGYLAQIRLTSNWDLNGSTIIDRFVNNTGFQKDKATYVINCIAHGLGLTDIYYSYSKDNAIYIAQDDFDYTKTELEEDLKDRIKDEHGVVYSKDGNYLIECKKKSITSYKIKEGTKIICDSAFSGCKKLKSIQLPSNVISIGGLAFKDCKSLESFKITRNIKFIKYNPFPGCDSITLEGENDEYVTIDDCLYSKDRKTLISYNSYKHNDTTNKSVQTIGEYAFSGNKTISSLTITDNVSSIKECAFENCEELRIIKLPTKINHLGDGVSWDCHKLISISIPQGITSIGSFTFANCECLSNIEIPEGVNLIDSYAFENCSSIVSLNFPSSLMTIENSAFDRCENLNDVHFKEGLGIIGDWAFNHSSISKLQLPKSIKSIGKSAFAFNEKIVHLSLPEGLVFLGEDAFLWSSSLETVDLPMSLTKIEKECFSSCHKLQKITIPKGTKGRFEKLLDKTLHKLLSER